MPRITSNEVQQLHRGHFAFLRAVLQGVDPVTSWTAYMQLECSTVTARKSWEEVARVREKCVAAAWRDGQHRVARLLRLELDLPVDQSDGLEPATTPHLAVPKPPRAATAVADPAKMRKRTCLVQRQIDALRELEMKSLARMSAGDPVSRWLPRSMAKLLEQAGISNLASLTACLNINSENWWRHVPAVSRVKAARIAAWAQFHAQDLGVYLPPRSESENEASEFRRHCRSATLAPWEHFDVPYELDGHDGAFRMSTSECLLDAVTNRQALEAWFNSASSPHSFRAYRNQAERLLLWCVLVRRKAVSSLTHIDAKAYMDFLAHPPEHWCGPRYGVRESQSWRPFEGGLSIGSRRQANRLLVTLFKYLVKHRYLHNHPFLELTAADSARPDARQRRTLTVGQWDQVERALDEYLKANATHEPSRRRARAIRWLYATGLTLSEMKNLQCGSLREVRLSVDGIPTKGWIAVVVGRRGVIREVPVPPQLIAELAHELILFGRPSAPTDRENACVPIVGRFSSAHGHTPPPWTGIYKAIRSFMQACAERLGDEDAAQVRLVTCAWLRNTYGKHALTGRGDATRKPIPLQDVAASMGCSPAWLISQHPSSTGRERHEAMVAYWSPKKKQ